MINKYRNSNKDLKEYKASRVKTGTAKNGANYTMCQIADAKKEPNGQFSYDNYTVFSWQPDINLQEGDKIALADITALEVKTREYNGKTYVDKTIFADIKITTSANPNKVDVVGEMQPIDEDSLPF